MTYIRKRPWRPRSPWLGNRAGARRRGFRQDELCRSADGHQHGVDLVVSVASDAVIEDDVVLAEATAQPLANGAVAPRIDVSGLLAIASTAPRPALSDGGGALASTGWYARTDEGGEEPFLARHSA